MKKLTALILSALMIFALIPFAFAAEVTPVIVVSGMGSYPLYEKASGEQVYGPKTEKIVSLVAENLPAAAKFLIDRNWEDFSDAIARDVYTELFEPISCEKDGTPKYELYTKTFSESVDNYPDEWPTDERLADEEAVICAMRDAVGAENTYFFNYDWRLDPLDHADDLKVFIEKVKKEKNAEKVVLIPCSMGGIVTTSYLSKYGSDSIEKIIFAMTAFQGMDMMGELFNKRMVINVDTLTEYFFTMSKDQLFMQILAATLDLVTEAFPQIGNSLDNFIADGLSRVNDQVYEDVMRDSFVSCVGFWSFVPLEEYESAKKAMLGDSIDKTFEEKIDNYHYNVLAKSKELLDEAIQNETAIVLLSSYGYVGSPFANSAYTQGDCLIECYREAGGATVAPYGETLGDEGYEIKGTVCNNKKHNHLSTDCIVDASTGMYPEYTWYLKYNKHVGLDYKTDCSDFLSWLVLTKGQPTVHDNEKYPQFMKFDNITGELSSLTGSEVRIDRLDGKTTVLTRLIIILKTLYVTIKNTFKGLEK